MPRIDFHILPDANPHSRLEYACRLTAKAWRQGFAVLVHCADQAMGEQLDQLLWQRPAASFIPHRQAGAAGSAPVLIAWPGAGELNPGNGQHYPVLVNLCPQVPAWYEGHQRIIEVVNQEARLKDALRQSFASYRQRGYSPEHQYISSEHLQ